MIFTSLKGLFSEAFDLLTLEQVFIFLFSLDYFEFKNEIDSEYNL